MEKTLPKFSIVLIAKNEEDTLPRLLVSLNDFKTRGGEIILVDTGSTDNTAKLARENGCRVEEVGDKFLVTLDEKIANNINEAFVFLDQPIVKAGDTIFDYSSARNYAHTLASNNMVATPDCDEIYTILDIDFINQKIDEGIEQFEYPFVYSHDEEGKPVIQFTHSKFYNKTKMKWTGVIHEVLAGDSIKLMTDRIKLEHFQNTETDRSRYLTGLAYDCYVNHHNDRNRHYFARELMYIGRYESAIEQFQIHINMDGWPTERAQSMCFIGDCYMYLGDIEEAIAWYGVSFHNEPNRRQPLMKLAEYYYTKQLPHQAIAYALASTTVKDISYYGNYQPYLENFPHEILYWAYWQIGDKEKSKEHWKKALEFSPNNEKYLKDKQFYE
jgi:glycosyltransferase involved in cell wall biosynthesis